MLTYLTSTQLSIRIVFEISICSFDNVSDCVLINQSVCHMRSLPPPRITRARKWKRIKRAIKNLFSKGYISDYGVFSRIQANHYSISKIRRLRFSTRLVKSRNDLNIVKRANRGFKLANYISRASRRVSVSGLKRGLRSPKSRMDFRINF